MDTGISKPTAPKLAGTKATDPSPGGRRTRGPRKKGVASDGPVTPTGNPQCRNVPKLPRSANRFAWLKKGTGRSLKTIGSSQLEASTTPVSSSAGFELLCTYNWVSTPSPTIYVPGGPAQWKPVTLPTTLPKDSGTHFIDQNAFRAPAYPFEPIFAALDLMKPDFDFGGVDLVTNRNSLRKLLDFASGRVSESFRIDINLVHGTLFLTRREQSTRDRIHGSRNAGYGHNFEKAFTRAEKGLEESSGHHRVVRYQMGELECVVRFEVDAWCGSEGDGCDVLQQHGRADKQSGNFSGTEDVLEGLTKLSLSEDPTPKTSAQKAEEAKGQETDDIIAKLKQLSVNESKEGMKPAQYKRTYVIPRGRLVPCSTLAEIKAKKRKPWLADALPQLWFGRTPLLFYATHYEGRFTEEVTRINAGEKFEEWEMQQQEVLRKMVRLIGQLRGVAREAKGGTCVAVCESKIRPLKVEMFESTARTSVLPEELVGRYWREGRIPSGP